MWKSPIQFAARRGYASIAQCALLGIVVLTSCQHKSAAQPKPSLHVPNQPEVGDIARFLAGIKGRDEGPFKKLEKEPAFRWHSSQFTKLWATVEKERLPAMRAFQKKEIAQQAFASKTLFYPFGGPDVLTAMTFFPGRDTYILVGLEPPGSLPGVESLLARDLEKYLPRVERTLDTLLRKSFFITANMDVQLRGQITDGLLPVMLVQLVSMQASIDGYLPITLNEQGEIVARKEKKEPASSRRNDGMLIEFHMPNQSRMQRVIYLSVDLGDEALEKNKSFHSFIGAQKPVATFFKSASYLPHRKDFSRVRDLVLNVSRSIFQDDTGIPYRFIDQEKWDVRLYGRYTQPYGSFKFMMQPDLKKAYEEGRPVPLDFFLGYGYKRSPSALQVFLRKS